MVEREFNDIVQTITDRENRYLIWGTDEFAVQFYHKYRKELVIMGFVDPCENHPVFFLGYKVFAPGELEKYRGKYIIIVAKRRNKEIQEADAMLDKIGWQNRGNYFHLKLFEAVYDACIHDKATFNFVEMTITEVCTLRCKNCSQFMPYFQSPTHTGLERIKKDIDNLFKTIDYTFHFRLLGGETFLHPDIEEIIRYVAERYRNRIDFFDIVTNGTVMPGEETFRLCEEWNITVSISDYDINETYEKKVENLVEELIKYGVDFRRNRIDHWYEIGFPKVRDDSLSEEMRRNLFDECQTDWRNYHDGKLFFCSVCACAQRAGLIEGIRNDYFEFTESINKTELLRFNLGVNDVGYNSLCGLCKGYMPSVNRKFVKPGVQMTQEELLKRFEE